MRKFTLIRGGLACALIAGGLAGGIFAAGCSGDDNKNNNNTPGDDAGLDATQPTPDSSTTDTGTTQSDGGMDAGDTGTTMSNHGKLILVHSAKTKKSLRFCFGFPATSGSGVNVSPTFPAPNNAFGVPQGTGGAAADTALDLAMRTIVVYAVDASAITAQTADAGAAELACNKLILPGTDGGLAEGTEYWTLGTLPAGTLTDGSTTLLLLKGDTADNSLAFWPFKLDRTTTIDGGSIGAQFAYASQGFADLTSDAGASAGFFTVTTVVPDAGADDAGDAGDAAPAPTLQPIAPLVAMNATNGTLSSPLVSVSGVPFAPTAQSGFIVVFGSDPATAIKVPMPLADIQALSAPGSTAPLFANGNGYVFVLVGDPLAPAFISPDGGALAEDAGGTFNLASPHILGYPVNPPFGAP